MKSSTLRELLRLLLSTHFSNRHIAQLTQLSKTTVRRYRSRINKSECCWGEVKQLDDPALFRLVSSSSGLKPDKRAPDWSHIHKLLQDKHQCRLQIWEEYRRINPDDAYCYSQFNKYYRDYRKTIDLCMRQHYEPGDVCFVDYAGKRLSFVDSATGQTQKVELFVGVLGYSQLIFCVEVKVGHQKVEIFHQHHRVAIHPRSHRKEDATTYPEHRPTQHQAYANQTRDYFINWAKEQSADVLAVVTAQFENLPEHSLKGVRACSKLQKLCRHYGVQRFMNACTCVTEIQSLTVTSVHSILQCHLDGQQITETTTQHKLPAHSNVRGASYYADHEGHLK
ncbi:hypothetical protein [Endozoicomonas sp. ALB091]|uniref:hypothetical protein n=2 Tax=unclassified Endozoicomonas TaxID=2644528 RepID=UPI003BB4F074